MIPRTTSTIMKQGDTAPALEVVLMENDDPVDLTAAGAVEVVARRAGNPVPVFVRTMQVEDQPGHATYQWQAGDTDQVGDLQVEFKVTWPGGAVQTFPAQGYLVVEVVDSIWR